MSYYPNVYASQAGPLALSTLDANFNFAVDIQSQSLYAAAGGASDAITATYTPSVTTLISGLTLYLRATAANTTTTPTFAPNGLTAKTIVKYNNQALVAGDIAGAGHILILQYDATNGVWELVNPATISTNYPGGTANAVTYLNASKVLSTSTNFKFNGYNILLGGISSNSSTTPGKTIALSPGGAGGNGSFQASNYIVEMPLVSSPSAVGAISWGYSNAGANTYAYASINVRGNAAGTNGSGLMSFLLRSVTTDTAPTSVLQLDPSDFSVKATSTGGIGYGTGAGGTVTQVTSISTAVTLNTPTGKITCVSNTFTSGTTYSFVVNNSGVTFYDCIVVNLDVNSTLGNTNAYQIWAVGGSNGDFNMCIRTNSTVTNTLVINYTIIKGAGA